MKDEGCCDYVGSADGGGEVSGCVERDDGGAAGSGCGDRGVRRTGIDEESVEECLTGCVLRAGLLQEAVAAVRVCRPDRRTAVALR